MQAERHWYFAREGKQYGPYSEVELVDFYRANQLLPTDLFWCQGFSEWQPHSVLFGSQQPAATQSEGTKGDVKERFPPSHDADHGQEVVAQQIDEPEQTPRALWVWMALKVSLAVACAVLLGAAIAYAYREFIQ